ncbi:MAG: histidine kinase [Bacteroidota bacterium]
MFNTKKRFLYMIAVGILIAILAELIRPDRPEPDNYIIKFILSIIMTIILWEGNLRIDHWLNSKYSWIKDTRKRLFMQSVLSPLFTLVTLFSLLSFTHLILRHPDNDDPRRPFDPLFIPGLSIAFLIITIDISNQFLKFWKQSIVELEKMKTEHANAKLLNLKNQLNPHFLFNNLSVLTSLVYKSQDKAVEFINELSKVYRYSIENTNVELGLLKDELTFLNHYLYLLKIRFNDNLIFNINIDEKSKNQYLPPMCLQMLVENTIQHNESSQLNPLTVSIYTDQNHIVVENPIQPRSNQVESSKMGLTNIQSRYSFFTDDKVKITTDNNIFKVTLPLISRL